MSIITSTNCIYIHLIFLLIYLHISFFIYYLSTIGLDILNSDDFVVQYFKSKGRCVAITEIIDMKRTETVIKCSLDTHPYNFNELS